VVVLALLVGFTHADVRVNSGHTGQSLGKTGSVFRNGAGGSGGGSGSGSSIRGRSGAVDRNSGMSGSMSSGSNDKKASLSGEQLAGMLTMMAAMQARNLDASFRSPMIIWLS